jgi:hypothetical protein
LPVFLESLFDQPRHRQARRPGVALLERGTLLASGFIAGEAILAIVLSVAFIGAERMGFADFSVTKLLRLTDPQPIYEHWGGWLSLIVFGVVAGVLIRGPLRKSRPE